MCLLKGRAFLQAIQGSPVAWCLEAVTEHLARIISLSALRRGQKSLLGCNLWTTALASSMQTKYVYLVRVSLIFFFYFFFFPKKRHSAPCCVSFYLLASVWEAGLYQSARSFPFLFWPVSLRTHNIPLCGHTRTSKDIEGRGRVWTAFQGRTLYEPGRGRREELGAVEASGSAGKGGVIRWKP